MSFSFWVLGEQILDRSEGIPGHNSEQNHLQQQERDCRDGEGMPEQETPPNQRYSTKP